MLHVNGFCVSASCTSAILPSRPKQSAEAYHKNLDSRGFSPGRDQQEGASAAAEALEPAVGLAMRYQNPSIPDAVPQARSQEWMISFLFPFFRITRCRATRPQ